MSTPASRDITCDIFCTVIDNYGDIGVCWRLARGLFARGRRVRLWVDDASALAWMAPQAEVTWPGIQVLTWQSPLAPGVLASAGLDAQPCRLLIEAFGCEPAPEFLAACFAQALAEGDGKDLPAQPAWINLEYLSAESYVERSHGLPSLVRSGPAAGWTRHFFYPGFTERTGGLLRERALADEQGAFDRDAWLATQGIPRPGETGELLVSLFCYEPPALPGLLDDLASHGLAGRPVRLLVAEGRARRAVEAALAQDSGAARNRLAITWLPLLDQTDFDRLLWACDFNFVRGEDSLVRAIWAGRPFLWQIYPQDDGAHHPKLEAFLEVMDFPADLQASFRLWNATAAGGRLPLQTPAGWDRWQSAARAARARLAGLDDLVSQLIRFAQKNR